MRLKEAAPTAGPRRPDRTFEVPVSAWAETVEDRPSAPVLVGIRLPSEQDEREAGAEGDEREEEAQSSTEEERIRAYNSGVIVRMVSAGVCLALDASQPFFSSYLEAERRLTKDGLRLLYDQIEILQIAARVYIGEADDEAFSHLVALWDRDAIERLSDIEKRRVRRVIEWCRQALAAAEEDADREDLERVG